MPVVIGRCLNMVVKQAEEDDIMEDMDEEEKDNKKAKNDNLKQPKLVDTKHKFKKQTVKD